MKIGVSLPTMEPGLADRDLMLRWFRDLDESPFSTVGIGERISYPNPELFTTLGACAAATERIGIMTTVLVLPMHDPVLTAKQLATVDCLSGGRLQVGVGIGGREEDYLSIGADLNDRRNAELGRRVALMREVWRGSYRAEPAKLPVGPQPLQPDGLPVLSGAMGPKALRMAAEWADGVVGFSFGPNFVNDIADYVERARAAWQEAGRGEEPRLAQGFWYAFDSTGGRSQIERHLRTYLNFMDPQTVEAMIPYAGFAGSPVELRELLRQLDELGIEEILLTPTSNDPDEIVRLADAVG